MVRKALALLILGAVVVALLVYVYPHHPYIAWALLGFSWACFRLTLRAKAMFGGREAEKGGRRRRIPGTASAKVKDPPRA